MAFSSVDSQSRIQLPKDLCDYAGIIYGKGVKFYIVDMNDAGTEFDMISENLFHGNDTCIDAIVHSDDKARVCMQKVLKWLKPGMSFKITACKGRLHLKKIP